MVSYILQDPLCGCTGSGPTCGKDINSWEDEETCPPTQPLPAVSGAHPVCAIDYDPDPMDPIDMELSWHLMSTDHTALSKLTLHRLEPGEYAIDSRLVSIHWGTFAALAGPCRSAELLVSEGREDGDWDSLETPLAVYLRQALDVAASLGGHASSGAPAVARVPAEERLSFFNIPAVSPAADADDERVACMKRACQEARLRELAVEASERRARDGGVPRATSSSLTMESQIPPLPLQNGSLTPSSSMGSRQFYPAAYGYCGGLSRGPTTVVQAGPPSISRLTSGLPTVTTCIRKV